MSISIRATSTATFTLPQQMWVDGVPTTPWGYFGEISGHWEYDYWAEQDVWVVDEWDYRDLTTYYYLSGLSDGPHSVAVRVTDSEGGSADHSWAFTVAQPPGIYTAYPQTMSGGTTPLIRVPFSDNGGTHTAVATVGGISVPMTRVGNEFQGTVPQALPSGQLVNASATVTDEGGLSTTYNWSFRVVTPDQITATMTPADGSNQSAYPSISCVASGYAPITQIRFTVAGRTPYNGTITTQDARHWRANYHGSPLPDGSVTATATVTDTLGNQKSFSTTFSVNHAPWVAGHNPANGSRVETGTPTISVGVSDNSPGVTATMKVDGVVVPATLTGSTLSFRPSAPLTPNADHNVWVEAVDAVGNKTASSWNFYVDKYAKMAMADCASCHSAYPATHEARTCESCHGSAPHGDTNCGSCHSSHGFTGCSCHSGISDSRHETAVGGPHLSTTSFGGCVACHDVSLTREHGRYNNAGGVPLDCQTCHAATASPAVKTAVALKDTRCVACHAKADHVPLHVSTTSSSCFGSGCHPASKNLADVHRAFAGPGSERPQYANECKLCHENPAVNTATSGVRCTPACHAVLTHSQYATSHDPGPASDSCLTCHTGDLSSIHGAGPSDWTKCDRCHSSASNWSKTADCSSCHQAHSHPDDGLVGRRTDDGRLCTDCHSPDVVTEHSKPTATSAAAACDTCHAGGGPVEQLGGAWDGSCDTPACHGAASGRPVHSRYCLGCHAQQSSTDFAGGIAADFTASSAVDRDTACRKCHLPSLANTHPFHYPGGSCDQCHAGWGPSRITAIPRVISAYGAFAYPESAQTSPDRLHQIHARATWPAGVSKPSSRCASCHAVASCASCHDPDASPLHAAHATTAVGEAPAAVAWGGVVAEGVVSSQAEVSDHADTARCGSLLCHGGPRTGEGAPLLRESHSHPANGSTPANTVLRTGGWKDVYGAAYTAGRAALSTAANATLQIGFSGTRVEVLSDTGPNRGIAEVFVDDVKVSTIDLYSAVSRTQKAVFDSGAVGAGVHTVRVRATGLKNVKSTATAVGVDQIRVYSVPEKPIVPDCSSCHASKTSDHP